MHSRPVRVVVAAITHVHMYLAGALPDHGPDLFQLFGQPVAIVGIARVTLRADQPSITAGNCHAHCVAVLMLLARLALGDTLDFRFMYAVNLVLIELLLRVNSMRGF